MKDIKRLKASIKAAKAKIHLMQPVAASDLRRMIWYYEDKIKEIESKK